METVNAPGFRAAAASSSEAKLFRVIEGEYLYEVDGKRFRAAAGDIVSVPGGVAHTFSNLSASPSRQLVLMLPAMDAMKFFVGLGEIMKPRASGAGDIKCLWRDLGRGVSWAADQGY